MTSPTLVFTMPPQHLFLFYPLLRQGVGVATHEGRTAYDFLHEELGLSREIIQARVQTVFLNNQPADDLKQTRLAEGDVLSLSAAMPGLLGACLRVDSPYAQMRDSISQSRSTRQQSTETTQAIRITLKLFNFMAREIGPCVCSRGIFLTPDRVLDLLQRAADQGLLSDEMPLTLDGSPFDPSQEPGRTWLSKAETVLLRTIEF